jgi:ABC-2 type transport system ATP-binding protein/lipopolysaccharide transport system ATP-binding protein
MSSIELKNVYLDYIIKTGSDSLKKSLTHLCARALGKTANTNSPALQHSSYRALNDINLTINTGERIGLLGRNGAGKSTLLRVLAKVYQPNVGSVHIKGNISSLFDVSLGMNDEATGYENIINLGVMRGLTRKQSNMMVEDVAAFSELGDFLNRPVRTYSTGMRMKLAFAVATGASPDIILVDEIIGVGDAHFMAKAQQRMTDLINKSDILVLTSHSNDIIRRFCNKGVVLDGGEVQFVGDIEAAIECYQGLVI